MKTSKAPDRARVQQHDKQADGKRIQAGSLRTRGPERVNEQADQSDDGRGDEQLHAPKPAPSPGLRRIDLEVPGPPPRKNRRIAVVGGARPRLVTHKDTREWWARLALAWVGTRERPIASGAWSIQIVSYWARERHMDDLSFAMGDVDAPVSCILDGLQQVGALDDDVRIDAVHAEKRYDCARPRVQVTLIEVLPDE